MACQQMEQLCLKICFVTFVIRWRNIMEKQPCCAMSLSSYYSQNVCIWICSDNLGLVSLWDKFYLTWKVSLNVNWSCNIHRDLTNLLSAVILSHRKQWTAVRVWRRRGTISKKDSAEVGVFQIKLISLPRSFVGFF